MIGKLEKVNTALSIGHTQISTACTELDALNPLAKHLPQYKELKQMALDIGRIQRELQKEVI